jgi:hypothetical protein
MDLTGLSITPFITHFFIASLLYDGLVCLVSDMVSDNRHLLLLKCFEGQNKTFDDAHISKMLFTKFRVKFAKKDHVTMKNH